MRMEQEVDEAIHELDLTISEAFAEGKLPEAMSVAGIRRALLWVKGEEGQFARLVRDLKGISAKERSYAN